MPRGRLIFPVYADLAQIDTALTSYDDDFAEPTVARVEATTRVKVQVEDESWETLRMLATGRAPDGKVVLVMHYLELETAGLIDATTGEAGIRVTARLDALRRYPSATLIQTIRTPPGLYCVEAMPRSFGLAVTEARPNLLVCTFEPRDVSTAR